MQILSPFGTLEPNNSQLLLVILYAKQKHLECKKVQGQSEATLLTGMCDQKL